MTTPDLLAALEPVVQILDDLGVSYSVVGSVASSAHGIARATLDADLVAEIPEALVDSIVDRLQLNYYVDRDAAYEAVRRRSMFNAIHFATMIKVDVYVLTDRPYDREAFGRRLTRALDTRSYQLDTAEDTVLHKLEYRAGGEDRQWADIVGVLAIQGDALDGAYLDHWASILGVSDLLARAWSASTSA